MDLIGRIGRHEDHFGALNGVSARNFPGSSGAPALLDHQLPANLPLCAYSEDGHGLDTEYVIAQFCRRAAVPIQNPK
jgi:hypothetical protein